MPRLPFLLPQRSARCVSTSRWISDSSLISCRPGRYLKGTTTPICSRGRSMYPELAGKCALVTGAARGFGRAIALRLAEEGAQVAVNYRRSRSDAEAVVAEIEAAGGAAIALRGDVGDEASLDRLFGALRSEFAGLEIVVANA